MRIGDRDVSRIGMGTMPLSWQHMLGRRDLSIEAIHVALDCGVRLLDTSSRYLPDPRSKGHNESLVAEALASWPSIGQHRSEIVVATKGGIVWNVDGSEDRVGTRDGLRRAAEASARALNTDQIDLYYLHRLAPSPSMAEQVENLVALKEDGLVKEVGLSNVTADELKVGLDVAGGPAAGGIAAVENEYSPIYRGDPDVIALTRSHAIPFVAWSPLGGVDRFKDVGSRYEAFAQVAAAHEVSVQRVTLAWLLALSPNVACIPGFSRPETARDSVAALSLRLSEFERDLLSSTVPEGTSQYPDDVPRPPLR
jgi:aryl-alcohol dehydrogenase-like predicted oxidoreductase